MHHPLRTAILSTAVFCGLMTLSMNRASAFFVRQSPTQCFAAMAGNTLPTVSGNAKGVTVFGTDSNPPNFTVSTIWCPFPETNVIQKTSVRLINAYARSLINGGGLSVTPCIGFFDADGGLCDPAKVATKDSTNQIAVQFGQRPAVWNNNDGHFPYLIVTGIGPSAGAVVQIKGLFYSS